MSAWRETPVREAREFQDSPAAWSWSMSSSRQRRHAGITLLGLGGAEFVFALVLLSFSAHPAGLWSLAVVGPGTMCVSRPFFKQSRRFSTEAEEAEKTITAEPLADR